MPVDIDVRRVQIDEIEIERVIPIEFSFAITILATLLWLPLSERLTSEIIIMIVLIIVEIMTQWNDIVFDFHQWPNGLMWMVMSAIVIVVVPLRLTTWRCGWWTHEVCLVLRSMITIVVNVSCLKR